MSVEKKKTARVKFETKLYKREIRRAEKDTLRRLLSPSEDDLSTEEAPKADRIAVDRLVEKGVRDASTTQAHPHSP